MTEDGEALCTLDELTELVEAALAVDYVGAPTARVRDVPDQRAIRWYVTRGLVDRPAGTRGRVALYGRRHLLQLVAIKRLQAQGRSLAEIQAELAGATDDALARVARVPADAAPRRTGPGTVDRFWTRRLDGAPGWAAPATEAVTAAADGARPARAARSVDFVHVQALRLAPGVTLLIDNGAADPAAVAAAARPLLDLLAAHGGVRHEEKS